MAIQVSTDAIAHLASFVFRKQAAHPGFDETSARCCNAAIAVRACVMTEIVDRILRASGHSDLDAQSRAKIIRYLETLRSAGNRDEQQLTTFGLAYLDQLFNPDPRYSGC
jgi:hypothetical protein